MVRRLRTHLPTTKAKVPVSHDKNCLAAIKRALELARIDPDRDDHDIAMQAIREAVMGRPTAAERR